MKSLGRSAARTAVRRCLALSCAAGGFFLAPSGCWDSGPIDGDSTRDVDGGDDSDETSTDDPIDDVACTDLSPCVETDAYGYTCPGAVNGVICWNLGSKCNATYLCANSSQACSLACDATSCTASSGSPPHPLCD